MTRPAQDNPEAILLVEDHLVLLELIKHILGNAGFTVIPASNAKEAMLLEAGHPGTIDLLLSDVRMRGLSGPDLATKLKRKRPEMCVVLMSGYPGGASLALDCGWHYIQKPFIASALVNRIQSILRGEHASTVGAT
jgi:DNA-binding response OmpR family regulator